MTLAYDITEEELDCLYNSLRDFKAPTHGGYIDTSMPMVYCLHPNFTDLNLYSFMIRCRGNINFYGITLSKKVEDFSVMAAHMKASDMLIEWPLWKTGWEKNEIERGEWLIVQFNNFLNSL